MSSSEGDSRSPARGISISFPECDRLHRALTDCHRRVPAGPSRQAACRHLNHSLAQCLIAVACPDESEAVRNLCSSGGTALKRHQCRQAQQSLAVCLSSHQLQES